MKVVAALPLLLAGCFVLSSCSQSKEESKQAGTSQAVLKDLVKEDVVVGKPTIFNPKQKPVETGDTVWVEYTGTLKDGTVFDTNDKKLKQGARPFSFTMGMHAVIVGWDKGLLGMLPGGVRKLSIPARMAYADKGQGKIPPNTDIYFTVKMLDYIKAGEEQVYGLHDDKIGTGAAVKAGSVVTFTYEVREVDGHVLDDKYSTKPVTITLGHKDTIASIESGLMGMKVGGVRQLWIPPMIGFMPSANTNVNPNTLFIVKMQLVGVK